MKRRRGEVIDSVKVVTDKLLSEGINPHHLGEVLENMGFSEKAIKRGKKHALRRGRLTTKPLEWNMHTAEILFFLAIIVGISTILIIDAVTAWPGVGHDTTAPLQTAIIGNDTIPVHIGTETYQVTPLKHYEATVMIAGKKRIYFQPASKLSPYDMSFTWGEHTQSDYTDAIRVQQGYRIARYTPKTGSPYSSTYIKEHFSNNHLIPANKDVRKELQKIKKHEVVRMEGYLISAESEHLLPWTSSLTRDDTGCEIFYVEKVSRIGRVYG